MNEYKKEKDILDGVKKAEEVLSKGDVWADEEDKTILRADKKVKERKRRLDAIVLARVCPSCKNRIFLDSCWVIEKELAWCRSCFHSSHKQIDGDVLGSIIKKVVIRVEFDGWKIKTLRHKMGVGSYAFSLKCGWTKAYQEQIERNAMRTLSLDSITTIIQVFEDIGVIIVDSI